VALQVDAEFLKEFEEQLEPARPEKSPIPAKLVGVGRISAAYEIIKEDQENIVYTRMPFFESVEQIEDYEKLYHRYNEQLKDIGVDISEYGTTQVVTKRGRTVLYLYRRKIPPKTTAIGVLNRIAGTECFALARLILREMNKVWKFNGKNRFGLEVSLDGRLSNWSLPALDTESPRIDGKTRLQHIPESTPLMKQDGHELLNAELFLLRATEITRPILRRRYMRDVLVRYYDLRRVSLDMLANFFREIRDSLVSGLIDVANQFIGEEAAVKHLVPLTPEEVRQYKAPTSTWKL
jgi:hypothetical protein